MESPQSVVSPFKTAIVTDDRSFCNVSNGRGDGMDESVDGRFIGVLEVYVHQARDIHNICIYHKQDVYARLCLTTDPDSAISTKIINGGGRNPVFDDRLRLNVRSLEASLKCEIYMMSRVKNYMEDQLLGFALIPLSEVVIRKGKLEKEFSLSSTDLFHSPAGYVQLSIQYEGDSPDLLVSPAIPAAKDLAIQDPVPDELDKIEFPDLRIANENQMMVSEYFGIQCDGLDSQTSESLVALDADNHQSLEGDVHVTESCSTAPTADSIGPPELDSPPSSVSTNEVSSSLVAGNSEISNGPMAFKMKEEVSNSTQKEKKSPDSGDSQRANSAGKLDEKTVKPLISVNVESEHKVVHQDIVDMFMKSMQQSTESLANMKLALDIDSSEPTNSGSSSSSNSNMQTTRTNGSRVFYGSSAFF